MSCENFCDHCGDCLDCVGYHYICCCGNCGWECEADSHKCNRIKGGSFCETHDEDKAGDGLKKPRAKGKGE